MDENDNCWFDVILDPETFDIVKSNDEFVANRLQTIFRTIKKQKPHLYTRYLSFITQLSFPKNWGLGTSSTLIYLLAEWAGIDPFELQFQIFGGSGYDIACAGAKGPILYYKEKRKPSIKICKFTNSRREI